MDVISKILWTKVDVYILLYKIIFSLLLCFLKGATVLSLLPGSRLQEVTRMLTIFANTVQLLQESFPELVTVIHVAPNQHVENYIDRAVCKWPVPAVLIPGGSPHLKYDALSVREKTYFEF